MQVSKMIFSLAVACAAAFGAASPAWAVKLKNVTVNGIPYSEGMVAPAADVLTLAGNIVTDPLDDFNSWYLPSIAKEPYPGVGFFAAGSDSCMVYSPSGLLNSPANPDAQIYWPDPSRCIPNFSISGNVTSTTTDLSFPLNLKYDLTTGAFSGIKVPVAGLSGQDSFTITYQLNHWSWDLNADNPNAIWPANSSLASLRWNTSATQYFKPQVTLSFKKSADTCTRRITGTAANGNTSLTLLTAIVPACGEATSNQKLWVLGYVPNNGWYYKKSDGSWNGLTDFQAATVDAAAYATGVTLPLTLAVIDHLDISGLASADFYVGYGSDANDLFSKSKFAAVYSKR